MTGIASLPWTFGAVATLAPRLAEVVPSPANFAAALNQAAAALGRQQSRQPSLKDTPARGPEVERWARAHLGARPAMDRRVVRKALEGFHLAVRSLLSEHGLVDALPVVARVDASGRLAVTGGRLDARRIERLANDDPAASAAAAQLAAVLAIGGAPNAGTGRFAPGSEASIVITPRDAILLDDAAPAASVPAA